MYENEERRIFVQKGKRVVAFLLTMGIVLSIPELSYAAEKPQAVTKETLSQSDSNPLTAMEEAGSENTLLVTGNPTSVGEAKKTESGGMSTLTFSSSESMESAKATLQSQGKQVETSQPITLEPQEKLDQSNPDQTVQADVEEAKANPVGKQEEKTDKAEEEKLSDTDVVVAILDTGISLDEESLKGRIVTFKDGAFVKVKDMDKTSLTEDQENSPYLDSNGHGTLMAKVMMEMGDNIYFYPVKAFGEDGESTVAKVYYGIEDAIQKKVDVISLSASGSGESKALQSAVEDCEKAKIPLVVSAGNSAADTKDFIPANLEKAIVVSATNRNKEFMGTSNFGATVDYSANGYAAEATEDPKEGSFYKGSSIASARVASYIAALKAVDKEVEVATVLNSLAEDLGEAGKDVYFGNGLLTKETVEAYVLAEKQKKAEEEKTQKTEDTPKAEDSPKPDPKAEDTPKTENQPVTLPTNVTAEDLQQSIQTNLRKTWKAGVFHVQNIGESGYVIVRVWQDAIGTGYSSYGSQSATSYYEVVCLTNGTIYIRDSAGNPLRYYHAGETFNMPLYGHTELEGSSYPDGGGTLAFSIQKTQDGLYNIDVSENYNCGAVGGKPTIHYTPYIMIYGGKSKDWPGYYYQEGALPLRKDDMNGDRAGHRAGSENAPIHAHIENDTFRWEHNLFQIYQGFSSNSDWNYGWVDNADFRGFWHESVYNVQYDAAGEKGYRFVLNGTEKAPEKDVIIDNTTHINLPYHTTYTTLNGSNVVRRAYISFVTGGEKVPSKKVDDTFQQWDKVNGNFTGDTWFPNQSGQNLGTGYEKAIFNDDGRFSFPKVTRDGYTFLGWTKDANTVKYNHGDTYAYYNAQNKHNGEWAKESPWKLEKNLENVNSDGDQTYYAVWRPNIYHLVFDKNGANGGSMKENIEKYVKENPDSVLYVNKKKEYGITVNTDLTGLVPNGNVTADGLPYTIDYPQRKAAYGQGFTYKDNRVMGAGWSLKENTPRADFEENWNKDSLKQTKIEDVAYKAGVRDKDGVEIRLYQIWDTAPQYTEVRNIYFTSSEANAGITEKQLIERSRVKATDREDGKLKGIYAKGTESNGASLFDAEEKTKIDKIWVLDFDSERLKGYGQVGFETITFRCQDYIGNVSDVTIKVGVTQDTAIETKTKKSDGSLDTEDNGNVKASANYFRFISKKYYDMNDPAKGHSLKDKSTWVSPHQHAKGGLEDESVWYYDDHLRNELTTAFKTQEIQKANDYAARRNNTDSFQENKKTSQYAYEMDAKTLVDARDYVDKNGIGKIETITDNGLINKQDKLSTFYDRFVKPTASTYGKEPGEYYVRFHSNGGQGTMKNEYMLVNESKCLDCSTFLKTGERVKGWSRTPNGPMLYENGQRVINLAAAGSTIDLYAVWEVVPNTYNVVYKGNGASGDDKADLVHVDSQYVIRSADTYSKKGMMFAGWLSSDGKTYNGSERVTNLARVGAVNTMIAQWTNIEYTLKYDLGGGTSSASTETKKEYGKVIYLAKEPIREGYTFTGWKVTGAADVSMNDTIYQAGAEWTYDQKGGEVTLVAQWEAKTVDVVLKSNNAKNETKTYKVKIGEKLPKNPFQSADTEKAFQGWAYNPQATTYEIDNEGTLNLSKWQERITLYAVWGDQFVTIKYNLDGGTYEGTTNTSTEYKTLSQRKYVGKNIDLLKAPKKKGYAFAGWVLTGVDASKGGETSYEGGTYFHTGEKSFMFNQNSGTVKMTANWLVGDLEIHYDPNGGTGTRVDDWLPIGALKAGSEASVIEDMTEFSKTSYKFVGWNTKANGSGITVADGAALTSGENDANGSRVDLNRLFPNGSLDVTLYAQWKLNEFTITYNYDGGMAPAGQPQKYVVGTGATIKKPTRSGFTFAGWTGTGLTEKTLNVKIGTTIEKDVSLTANWTQYVDKVYHPNYVTEMWTGEAYWFYMGKPNWDSDTWSAHYRDDDVYGKKAYPYTRAWARDYMDTWFAKYYGWHVIEANYGDYTGNTFYPVYYGDQNHKIDEGGYYDDAYWTNGEPPTNSATIN